MSKYSEFFLRSKSSVVQLETLEISHPSFTEIYRIVRNHTKGVNLRYEDGNTYYHRYYPLQIASKGSRGDLDQGLQITLGDLGEVLPKEIDAVKSSDTFSIKPIVKYRTFRSDDTTSVLFGPLTLKIKTFTFNRNGSTFEAIAPQLNINKTGELYKLDRFVPLRGFL